MVALRKEIKAQFPNLQFKLKTVSFMDLARDSKVFVECNDYGNPETYQAVKAIAKKHNALVS
jgi:hypothetical protein